MRPWASLAAANVASTSCQVPAAAIRQHQVSAVCQGP